MPTEQIQNKDQGPLIQRDDNIRLPSLDIISASAGSGKTYTMAMRLTQFFLSENIPHKSIKHILAITFTNLAAKELKERLILTLKKLALKDPETMKYFVPIISIPEEHIPAKAEAALKNILSQYSDLQVKTIDSFFSRVFRTSAHDYGLYSDCDITFQPRIILEQAFEELSKKVFSDSQLQKQFDRLTEIIAMQDKKDDQKKYAWNPFNTIQKKVIEIYQTIQKQKKHPSQTDQTESLIRIKNELSETAGELLRIIDESGFNINHLFINQLKAALTHNYIKLIDNKLYTDIFNKDQKKVKTPELQSIIIELHKQFNEQCMQFILLYVNNFYYPYVIAYRELSDYIKKIQRNNDEVPLADLHQYIRSHLTGSGRNTDTLDSIYERLGETLYHYMIDEFQDTAPVHWGNLFPLIENGLANGGSLFIVGDTKQSIYAFNDADWRILKGLIEETEKPRGKTFDSVEQYALRNLDTNYRSGGEIVEFNRYLFQEHIPALYNNPDDGKHQLALSALTAGGLINYEQKPKKENTGKGYVEVRILKPEDDFNSQLTDTIQELIRRGAPKKEIAVLTRRNEDVMDISNTLKLAGIDCVSFSSLDIRKQSLTNEIISLLAFLDSPVDNLAFCRFLLGDIFGKICPQSIEERRKFIFNNRQKTLYTAFRSTYEDIWKQRFEHVFNKTGYLTPYDLVCEVFSALDIYKHFSGESSTLTKFLETVKAFEQNSRNTLKEFLAFSEEDDADSWNILVSPDLDAIRVMTTHKAKGLDFGYVIAVFNDKKIKTPEGIYFKDDDDHVEILRINSALAERSKNYSEFKKTSNHDYRPLEELYHNKKLTETVEQFNLRYVTLTRPKHELYVFGVYTEKNNKSEKPAKTTKKTKPEKQEEKKIGALDWLDIPDKIRGKKENIEPDTKNKTRTTDFVYPDRVVIAESLTRHKIRNDERYRGDILHFILSKIEYVPADLTGRFRDIANTYPLPCDYIPTEDDFTTMAAMIGRPELNQYFESAPGRIVKNEQEFTDAGGTRRVDRLVIDPQEVTIIDYKTGTTDDETKYEEQIRAYQAIIRTFYPGRAVKGILAYIDQNRIREIL